MLYIEIGVLIEQKWQNYYLSPCSNSSSSRTTDLIFCIKVLGDSDIFSGTI